MRFLASLWCLVVLGLLLLVSPAQAQDAPAEAPAAPASPAAAEESDDPAADIEKRKEEAKVRFQRGIELVQNENWDAALAEFLASRELFPTRVALKNAALCLRQLKRHVEALAMYNELLEKFGSAIPAEERKTIDEAIANLKKNVGEIQVDSDQPGSTVVIDGQQQKGVTPMGAVGVNAGTHTVRVVKEGYEAYEEQVLVAGGQRKTVSAKLTALKASGRLVVREAAGKTLEVVVDGAVVGKTPVYQGVVAAGPHVVFLQEADGNLGTAPTPANVKEGSTTNLTLSAVPLDAEIRVEPTPANARVDIDGVQIGNGVWEGRLPSGPHTVEVAAEGFIPFRKEVRLIKGEHEDVKVRLERDLSNPMWSAGFVPHLYIELFGGPAIATTFGGGADEACSAGDCDAGLPFGFLAGLRGGYQLTRGLGVGIALGYVRMKESMTRTVDITGEPDPNTMENVIFTSDDYQDETTFGGPFAAVSAAYTFLEETPLTFRFSAGAARVQATFKNGGTFTGTITNPDDADESATITQEVRIPERDASIWVPFIAPEARFGYRLGKKFTIDLGVAFFVMLPGETPRTGDNELSLSEGQRRASLRDVPDAFQTGNTTARPGIVAFPEENGFSTFFAVVPTLGARLAF